MIRGEYIYPKDYQDRYLGRRSDQSDSNTDPTDARTFSIVKGREHPFGLIVFRQLPVILGHRM